MDEAKKGVMQCGYYDIEIKVKRKAIGEHTYGRADGNTVNFHCYGGVSAGKEKHPVYPARFSGQTKWRGKQIKVDLGRARYYAANGLKGWNGRKDYNKRPKDPFHPKGTLGDSSGLLYAVGGVCHQMANAIFIAEGKGPLESSMVWPPSFYVTRTLFGIRGNHAWAWEWPNRLKYLWKHYPKDVPEHVDTLTEDPGALLGPEPDDDWVANMKRENRDLMGEDYALAGHEDAYVELQRALLSEKRDAVGGLLGGKQEGTDFAARLNGVGASFGQEAAAHLRPDLAAEHLAILGAAVDPGQMEEPETYSMLGDRLRRE